MGDSHTPNLLRKAQLWLSKTRSVQAKRGANDRERSMKAFPFLQLPSEIRQMIYRELLLSTHPLIVHFRYAYWFETGTRPYPSILLANKQIHDEAAAVLYGENTWFSTMGMGIFQFGEVQRAHHETYEIPAGPLDMYLSWIKRFVLFPDGPPNWLRDGVLPKGDVASMLRRMGIPRDTLKEFSVGVIGDQMANEIADANEDWLEDKDDEEMQKKFAWYRNGNAKPAFWLSLKDEER